MVSLAKSQKIGLWCPLVEMRADFLEDFGAISRWHDIICVHPAHCLNY